MFEQFIHTAVNVCLFISLLFAIPCTKGLICMTLPSLLEVEVSLFPNLFISKRKYRYRYIDVDIDIQMPYECHIYKVVL